MNRRLEEWMLHWFPTVGRLLMALLFIDAGFGKMDNFVATVQYAASAGVPQPEMAVFLATIVELAGGLFLLIGFKAREAAMVLSTAVVLYSLFFHLNINDQLQLTMLLKNCGIIGGLLYVIAFGAGKLSFDLIGEDEKIRKLTTSSM